VNSGLYAGRCVCFNDSLAGIGWVVSGGRERKKRETKVKSCRVSSFENGLGGKYLVPEAIETALGDDNLWYRSQTKEPFQQAPPSPELM